MTERDGSDANRRDEMANLWASLSRNEIAYVPAASSKPKKRQMGFPPYPCARNRQGLNMKRLIYTLGAVLLLAGCAHDRGGTGTTYDTDYGRGYSNGPDSDLSS